MNIELCRKFLEQWRDCTLFAGFSGGADSTAALLTALYFKEEYAIDLRAVHFDHHLRGSASDEDALFCRRFAEEHGIPISVIDLDIPSGNGLEETARLARLDHWKRLAGSKNKCAVILGHHRDDLIENFFLRTIISLFIYFLFLGAYYNIFYINLQENFYLLFTNNFDTCII